MFTRFLFLAYQRSADIQNKKNNFNLSYPLNKTKIEENDAKLIPKKDEQNNDLRHIIQEEKSNLLNKLCGRKCNRAIYEDDSKYEKQGAKYIRNLNRHGKWYKRFKHILKKVNGRTKRANRFSKRAAVKRKKYLMIRKKRKCNAMMCGWRG